MSYKRQKQTHRYASFDIVSQASGLMLDEARTPEEVMDLAEHYEQGIDVLVIGIGEDGHQGQTWQLEEVFSGRFQDDLDGIERAIQEEEERKAEEAEKDPKVVP